MNEWDIAKQIIHIEAVKTDAIIQHKLNELGWQYIPEGYVLVPTVPDKVLLYRIREILEDYNWRLSADNMRQLYSAVVKAAQEQE